MSPETERLVAYLKEEESNEKKANTSDNGGYSKTGASSSGPATSEEAPRSRGGVPMTTDSGDSLPEIVNRKIGEVEQREREDPKGKG